MLWVEPRSTSSHCGSENALDHRVDRFPSVAFDAGQDGPCIDDAVVGWCNAMFVVPQVAAWAAGPLITDTDRQAAARVRGAMMPIALAPERRRHRDSVRGRRLMKALSGRETQGWPQRRRRAGGDAACCSRSPRSGTSVELSWILSYFKA